jgi:hypothetical protein
MQSWPIDHGVMGQVIGNVNAQCESDWKNEEFPTWSTFSMLFSLSLSKSGSFLIAFVKMDAMVRQTLSG